MSDNNKKRSLVELRDVMAKEHGIKRAKRFHEKMNIDILGQPIPAPEFPDTFAEMDFRSGFDASTAIHKERINKLLIALETIAGKESNYPPLKNYDLILIPFINFARQTLQKNG